ncbi:MAG: 50S ribosomal protein L22 [Candidatus Wildermuthbacteria bacterium]|nr:50S ribosomal protein L22 [Candidatus Wildermuthbacteria bacterium]
MKAIARLQYLRISARKVRMVADVIRGKRVPEARMLLRFLIKRGAEPVLKTLHSAVVSAKNNQGIEEDNLYISKIVVDDGPKLKRFRPRARGAAYPIQKKVSHITIELDEIESGKKEIKSIDTEKREKEKEEVSQKNESVPKNQAKRFRERETAQKPVGRKGITKIFQRKAI